MDYIAHLQALLEEPPDLRDHEFPAVCTHVPYGAYPPAIRIEVYRETPEPLEDSDCIPGREEDTGHFRRPSLGVSTNPYSDTFWGHSEVQLTNDPHH